MQVYRFEFYRIDVSKTEKETRQYLGFVDVTAPKGGKLSDGCSLTAKAFRLATQDQRTANSVNVQQL